MEFQKRGRQRQIAMGWRRRSLEYPHYQHIDQPALFSSPTNASKAYMARPERSPPMKNRWRIDEDPRDRHIQRARERDRSERQPRSPASHHRGEPDESYRSRHRGEKRVFHPVAERDRSREARNPANRKLSISPKRGSNHKLPHAGRPKPFEERSSRNRELSPGRSFKRRRTQSPSPPQNHRHPSRRQRSSLSRERGYNKEIGQSINRGTSPHHTFLPPISIPTAREPPIENESHIPNKRRRNPTSPPAHKRELPSRSSPPHSKGPAPRRHGSKKYQKHNRDSPPYPPRDKDPKRLELVRSKHSVENIRPSSKAPSVADEADRDSMDGSYSMRGNYGMQNRHPRPYVDTRQQYSGSPPFATPNSSYHGSPQSSPPHYYNNRGGWIGHHGQMHNSTPPYRQNSFPGPATSQNPNHYYQQQQQNFGGPHPGPPVRGNHNQHRGGHHFSQQTADRRFSGPGPNPSQQNYNNQQRGRGGHFNNLQWTASNSKRGGSQGQHYQGSHPNSVQTSPAPSIHASNEPQEPAPEEDGPYRSSRDLKAEDQRDNRIGTSQDLQNHNQQKDSSKFSFAFKSKPPQSTPAKPPPDLTTKFKGPQRPVDNHVPPQNPKQKFHGRREEKSDFRSHDRRPESYNDRKHPRDRPTHYNNRRHDRSRSPPAKQVKKEPKLRPKLSPEFAQSESIYYRKPGNESVVGAGTYGKVFKAIHIYTKDQVALKRIRMEGERDGFPITAVREIRLLQHLRHKHVVSLQEVMVEKNECFMVFEYLSHDLTGLINHPTFKLTAAHKKDLARQMFDGLEHLHRRGVLHRDIKAANILISSTGQLKYADFGLARFYTKSRQLDYTNRVITIWYRPPELLLGETQYGPEVDIWSAACVFVEMFTKKAMFPGEGGELSQLEKVYNILGTPTRNDWPGIVDLPWFELMQPTERKKRVFETMFKDTFSPAALDMVKLMFRYDPTKRPNAEEILIHPYFTQEEPEPMQALELKDIIGDWHEFESKAHRREHDKREKEKRKEDYIREKEKRKAKEAGLSETAGPEKKVKPDTGDREKSFNSGSKLGANPTYRDGEDSEGEGSARMSMS